MHSPTSDSQMIHFGLTGRETQDTINESKYTALAVGTLPGRQLADLVEDHWMEWVYLVTDAPWLTNWKHSPLYNQPSCTPRGKPCNYEQASIAHAIYIRTVWGIGLDGWLRGEAATIHPARETRLNDLAVAQGKKHCSAITKVNEAMVSILELQNIANPSDYRRYFWDDKLYRGSGMLIPLEIGELDRWLEPLWLRIMDGFNAEDRKTICDALKKV